MNKNGGYTWMQTCATVICNSKNADEQNIICVNYVLSAKEHVNLILDQIQLENGLENSIKREEPVIDSGAGSPGSDPTTDGGGAASQGSNNSRPNDTQKSPKSETPEPRTRVRSHNSSNSNSAVLSVEQPITVPNRVEEVTVPVPTTGRRGTKRKMKVDIPVDEIDVIPTVLPEPQPIHPIVEDLGVESSVKDLENAMSKHLPSPVSNNQTTDFSTDALLKQQQDKSSTIQWIGHHNHHFHQQPPTMPATALLRQLYANRESVIRATTRPATSGVFYPDSSQTGPLPTPPGSESSFDNQFLLHSHPQKPSDAFNNLVSTYGGYPTSMDYHNAMTPPSSVSPRDTTNNTNNNNKTPSIHTATSGFEYSDPLRTQYGSPETNSVPQLPLKPQPAYSAMHHEAYSAAGLDQSQYFSHHTGFHLYHKGTPSGGWYTTPS